MSSTSAPSKRPTEQKSTARSGQHPAVQAYRAKLESVDRGVTIATDELDRALKEFLTDIKSSIPPKP